MRQYIDLITEASYDSMITALKAAYPDLADYITTQVRWAKAALKRDDRITWYLRIIKAYIVLNQTGKDTLTPLLGFPADTFGDAEIENIQHQVTHYFGFNIPEIEQYRFAKQTVDQLIDDLTDIYNVWEARQDSNDDQVPMQAGDYELIKFPNGSAWIFVDRAYCEREGKSGKHCGNVVGQHKTKQRILSYRVNGRVLMTFILEEDGFLGEMKAKGNQKPSEKLHPYIVELLLNPIVKGIRGAGYLPEMNFSMFDLNDQLFNRVKTARPEFVKQQVAADPAGITRAPKSVFDDPENIAVAYEKVPGLDLVMNTQGQWTKETDKWSEAMRVNPSLSFYAPEDHPAFMNAVKTALHKKPSDLLNAPTKIRRNRDLLFSIASENPSVMPFILPNTPGYDQLMVDLLKLNGRGLNYLHPEQVTPEMIQAGLASPQGTEIAETIYQYPNITVDLIGQAIKLSPNVLLDLPEKFYTSENFDRWLKISPRAFRYIPSRYQTQEMCEKVLSRDPFEFVHIPARFKNFRNMLIVADRLPVVMQIANSQLQSNQLTHDEYRTLATRAVRSTKTPALKYINPFFLTYELAETAVEYNIDNLQYIRNSELRDRVKTALNIDTKSNTQLPENSLRRLIDLTSK